MLTSLRESSQAGASPKINPAKIEIENVKTRTGRFTWTGFTYGTSSGIHETHAAVSEYASNAPAAPPASANKRLSVTNCLMILDRDAPSEARMAISARRAAERARRRLLIFAHAINSTRT